MKTPARREYEAAKDAYFARLLSIVEAMEANITNYKKAQTVPKDSGDPADGSLSETEGPKALTSGSLNANLAVIEADFTLFQCDVGHKQHPKCD